MQIIEKQIADLKPYGKNPRKNDEAVKYVAASIKEFGFKVPIIIDKDGVIVAGHTRYKAAKQLGLDTVPCIVADDLTPQQIKAFRLADNKVAEKAVWDEEMLRVEIEALQVMDFDLSLTGFDDTEIADLFATDTEAKEDNFNVDAEFEKPCITKAGDIWTLGRHRLICGDSTSVDDVEKLMNGEKADLVFTDPPYGMKKEAAGVLNDNLNYDDLLEFNKKWIPLTFEALKENGSWYCWGIDEPLMDIYSNILKPMAKKKEITFRNLITWDKGYGIGQLSKDFRMYPIADEKCLFVMCGTNGFNEKEENTVWSKPIANKIKKLLDERKISIREAKNIIGHSENSPNHFTDYWLFRFPKKEYFEKWGIEKKEYEDLKKEYDELKKDFYEGRSYFDNTHDNMNNVWHFDRTSRKERELTGGHATPKPIALCSRAIKSSSRENEIVLDVFGGSGSTLIACEQLDRTCYMMELAPKFCDVIVNRYIEQVGTNENVTVERDGKVYKYSEVASHE